MLTRRRIRVLYVGRFDIPSLMDRVRRGAAPSNHVHALPDLEALGFDVCSIALSQAELSSPWLFQRRVLSALADIDVIVAHAHLDVRLIALLRRARLIRQPLCAFVHSHNVRPWHRAYLRGFDVLWPVGRLGEQRVIANGAAPEGVVYFPYGADLRYYASALPWSDAEPIVLSVGVSGRDFATLIDAAAHIQAPVHIVGRVSPEDASRAPGNVTLHSTGKYDLSFSDLLALYGRAECVAVVHHGSEHPFGNTAIVEAMGHGRAIVSTTSAGLELDPGRRGSGFTVPPHDPVRLAEAVNALLRDREQARGMGAQARRLAETQFNCQIDADIMAASIETALARAGKPAYSVPG